MDDVALFAQIPKLTKQRLLTKMRCETPYNDFICAHCMEPEIWCIAVPCGYSCRRKRYAAGAEIIAQAEAADSFFIIETGVVTVWVDGEQARPLRPVHASGFSGIPFVFQFQLFKTPYEICICCISGLEFLHARLGFTADVR